jgi:hypothetical protein
MPDSLARVTEARESGKPSLRLWLFWPFAQSASPGPSMGEWRLSRRDRLIEARHEVPGLAMQRALVPEGRSKSWSEIFVVETEFNRPAGTGLFSSCRQALRAWLLSCCPSGTRYILPFEDLIKLALMGFQPRKRPTASRPVRAPDRLAKERIMRE